MELLSIHVGLLKVDYTPFLNFAIESEADLSFWNQEGYTMLSIRVGTFIYKSEKLESTIATGFAWNSDGNNASTSLLRFVFKPRKWFGIGVSINTNVNKDRFAAGGRILFNFGNGL